MTAADALLAAVGQARGPMAHGVAAQPDYGVAAQDGRPVDANEQGWVQLLLQLGDRPIDQPAALSHVEPHIVAFRGDPVDIAGGDPRSEEHTSELQSLMRISYAVFCL